MENFNSINFKLCHSCGTCVSVCPTFAISMSGDLPKLTGKCIDCGLCFRNCPGIEFSYPEYNEYLFGKSDVDREIGFYRSIKVGHAKDEAIRGKGASGGIVSALLVELLEKKEIAAAVVLGMDKSVPYQPKLKIARTKNDILDAAQSKYTMFSLNRVIRELDKVQGDVAYVGLPCHIHGVRKLQKSNVPAAARIKYCLGVFCGLNMDWSATDFLIRKSGIKKEEIKSLEYRGGEWPGGFLLKSKDRRKFFIKKHNYLYLNMMFIPRRCLQCPDLTNEFADISIGDAWSIKNDKRGYSTVIARTEKGEGLINHALSAGVLSLKDSNREQLKDSHGHLISYKKKGVFIRSKTLKPAPEFRIDAPSLSLRAEIFHKISLMSTLFTQTRFVRQLMRIIPVSLPGYLGAGLRRFLQIACRTPQGILQRIIQEYRYLTMKEWTYPEVGRFWDNIINYDDINKETYSYFRRFTDGYNLSSIPENSYILDICSRTGRGIRFFWDKGKVREAVCADVSQRFQEICAENLKKEGLNFKLKKIDSLPLPFSDGEFDAILCFETVEHLCNPGDFIKELARVLKKDGQILITTPNILWEPIHSLAAMLNLHHSEGPHRFIPRASLHKYAVNAGLNIMTEETTVLVPGGPKILIRIGKWLESRIGKPVMSLLGLRRILICRKNY